MTTQREQREQYNYARRRIVQKKRLMRHFALFLAGSVVLVIINPVLGIGHDWPVKNWSTWAILLWLFVFLVHAFNVLFFTAFMGREWEDRQLEKLKARQEDRIRELTKKVDADLLRTRSKMDDPPETDPEK